MNDLSQEEARAIRLRIASIKTQIERCDIEKDKCWRAVRRMIFSGKSDPPRYRFLRERAYQLIDHAANLQESLDNLPELCFLCDGIGCDLCAQSGLELDTIRRSISALVDTEEASFKKGC